MSEWIDVSAVDDLPPGSHQTVDVDDVMVVVFNLDGEFYAIEDVCTHDGSEISSGCVIDGQIECPRHLARFDIKTGEVTAPPAYEPIDVFPVSVEQGMVRVRDHRWD